MFKRIMKPRLKAFSRDESGMISVEAMILAPILCWAFVAVYTYFDAYRQSALNLKAAYTISDLVSRETQTIDATYINTMSELFGKMTQKSGSFARLRISVIRYDEDTDSHFIDWSANKGYETELTDDIIALMKDRLPVLPDEERLILVETSTTYVPPFRAGLDTMEMDNVVFTRPRFTGLIAASV